MKMDLSDTDLTASGKKRSFANTMDEQEEPVTTFESNIITPTPKKRSTSVDMDAMEAATALAGIALSSPRPHRIKVATDQDISAQACFRTSSVVQNPAIPQCKAPEASSQVYSPNSLPIGHYQFDDESRGTPPGFLSTTGTPGPTCPSSHSVSGSFYPLAPVQPWLYHVSYHDVMSPRYDLFQHQLHAASWQSMNHWRHPLVEVTRAQYRESYPGTPVEGPNVSAWPRPGKENQDPNEHAYKTSSPFPRKEKYVLQSLQNSSSKILSGTQSCLGFPSPDSLSIEGCNQNDNKWLGGSISLALPEDEDVLSPLHCFMRKFCVEAFSASLEDVAQPRYGKSHGNRVSIGQVGIRCVHCRDRSRSERAERAVCYPSSIKNIYHSVETWQRRHSASCQDIPSWMKAKLEKLTTTNRSSAGGRRQYWVDAAFRLGMTDTPQGVHFTKDPRNLSSVNSHAAPTSQIDMSTDHAAVIPGLVSMEDKPLVSDHLYLLMEQMQVCQFTEADRIGGRSKVKDNDIGFPGLQCKHCEGKAGFGRYFPSSVENLTLANSDRNIHNHMMKCRKCPEHIKSSLQNLQLTSADDVAKNKRGSRKTFFNRIWSRMHPTSLLARVKAQVLIHDMGLASP